MIVTLFIGPVFLITTIAPPQFGIQRLIFARFSSNKQRKVDVEVPSPGECQAVGNR